MRDTRGGRKRWVVSCCEKLPTWHHSRRRPSHLLSCVYSLLFSTTYAVWLWLPPYPRVAYSPTTIIHAIKK